MNLGIEGSNPNDRQSLELFMNNSGNIVTRACLLFKLRRNEVLFFKVFVSNVNFKSWIHLDSNPGPTVNDFIDLPFG